MIHYLLLPLAGFCLLATALAQDSLTVEMEVPVKKAALAEQRWLIAPADGKTSLAAALQTLAREAGLQFFPPSSVSAKTIEGEISLEDPRLSIQTLCQAYGFVNWEENRTLFVMPQAELLLMPKESVNYTFRYAVFQTPVGFTEGKDSTQSADSYYKQNTFDQHPSIVALKSIAAASGATISYDHFSKTLTIVGNRYATSTILSRVRSLDRQQVYVDLSISVLSISKKNSENTGVDWTQFLGAGGYKVSLGTGNSLDSIINMSAGSFAGPAAAILRPAEATLVYRALVERYKAENLKSTKVTLRENLPGFIKAVDRFPIIRPTVSTTTGGSTNSVPTSFEIDYKIDKNDRTPTATDPGRELGLALYAIAQVERLPGEKPIHHIALQPRVASIRELIALSVGSATQQINIPRVAENEIGSIYGIPDGDTAVLSGFLTYDGTNNSQGLPLLERLPIFSWLFKRTVKSLEESRILFLLTPRVYDPRNLPEVAVTKGDGTNMRENDHQPLFKEFGFDKENTAPKLP